MQKVIDHGARRVVVPGNFPMGCLPSNLATSKSNYSRAYDKYGCLKSLNAFSKKHNIMLVKELEVLKNKNPSVTILYGDLYSSFRSVLHHPEKIGETNFSATYLILIIGLKCIFN